MDNKGYSIEELNTRLDRVNGWIGNCDQKASILLAFTGVLLAVLLTSDVMVMVYESLFYPFYSYWIDGVDMGVSFKKIIIFVLMCLLCYHIIKMIKSLLGVLNPKTKDLFTQSSLLHFESIANMPLIEFKEKSKEQSLESYEDDLSTQIWINSQICSVKFINYQEGLKQVIRVLIFSALELACVLLIPQI